MLQNQHVHFRKLIDFHGKFENTGKNINSVEEYVFSKKMAGNFRAFMSLVNVRPCI